MLADPEPPRLGNSFRKLVGEKLGISIPEDAWWATDYHIDCLAGALALFVKGEEGSRENLSGLSGLPEREYRWLVEGNQEDLDLVIVTERNLILIEAKAYSGWLNKQMKSKLERLNILYEFYKSLIAPLHLPEQKLEFFFLTISPFEPPDKLVLDWPSWVRNKRDDFWIKLELYGERPLLVTRDKKEDGQPWSIKQT
jgi:hypothetical protein